MNGLGGLELCRHEESEIENCLERSQGGLALWGRIFFFIPDW